MIEASDEMLAWLRQSPPHIEFDDGGDEWISAEPLPDGEPLIAALHSFPSHTNGLTMEGGQ